VTASASTAHKPRAVETFEKATVIEHPFQPLCCSIKAAAQLTSLSRSEIYKLIDADRIEVVKHGTRTLVLFDSLSAFIASLRRGVS
jgi:excisionase family DNA binding protein